MDRQAACATIWALECEIYQGRAGGSFDAYIGMLAAGYLAWPPHRPAPIDGAALGRQSLAAAEALDMQLVDFTLHGGTAIIYYRTRRTMRPDGAPADDRFDVMHVWVAEDGGWKILGGMARATPVR